MALSTIAFPPNTKGGASLGNLKIQVASVDLGTYAAGGVAVDPKQFGMSFVLGLVHIGGKADAAPYKFSYDSVNKKLMVHFSGTAAAVLDEVGAIALTALDPDFLVIGF